MNVEFLSLLLSGGGGFWQVGWEASGLNGAHMGKGCLNVSIPMTDTTVVPLLPKPTKESGLAGAEPEVEEVGFKRNCTGRHSVLQRQMKLRRQNEADACVQVLGDRSMKLKYLNPNTVFVATGAPEGVPSGDLRRTPRVTVSIVDTVTGRFLIRQEHEVGPACHRH